MVTFELIDDRKDRLLYCYYPENKRDKKPGLIEVDRYDNSIKVTKAAEGDVGEHYGEHAVCKIAEKVRKGEVVKVGEVMWY